MKSIEFQKYSFLVTGGAGFIGSNLARYLVTQGAKKVRVLDNLSTGFKHNIADLESASNFEFVEGDICDIKMCHHALNGIDYVFHEAALGSVPRSLVDPITSAQSNIMGFLNILFAGKENKVKRIVYAGSSSTYGDSKNMPKVEDIIGKPLSPYAVTKYTDELFADVFSSAYGMDIVGLRYFNVFGPYQNKAGAYAAVIPIFINSVLEGKPPVINGDGTQSRDFTFIDNVIQANINAMFELAPNIQHEVFNVAFSSTTSLNQLWEMVTEIASVKLDAIHGPNRLGDIKDSLADISKAKRLLNYQPLVDVKKGLEITYHWYKNNYEKY